jgi:hypothetical protein
MPNMRLKNEHLRIEPHRINRINRTNKTEKAIYEVISRWRRRVEAAEWLQPRSVPQSQLVDAVR